MRRLATALGLGPAVAFALAGPGSPALAKNKPLPDLVPTTAGMNRYYAFNGQDSPGSRDTTKNVGKARARRTDTAFYLVHGNRRWLLTDRVVPALGPRESHHGDGSSVGQVSAPLGAFSVEVCVDAKNQVRESNESNNCKTLPTPRKFFVAAETWFGALSGTTPSSPGGTDHESWISNDASLDFDQYEGGGRFSYLFNGTVTWIDDGTSSGDDCTISGGGSKTYHDDASIGGLTVDYLHGEYLTGGLTEEPDGRFYNITTSCPFGGGGTSKGPLEQDFWDPSPDDLPIRLPFGATELPGSPSETVDEATWTWDLKSGFRTPSG